MKERADITFTGIGVAVSDLQAQDGVLSLSHNVIRDNGAMRAVAIPNDLMQLSEGETLVYIHETSLHRNYIVKKGLELYYFQNAEDEHVLVQGYTGEVKSISHIGNTLIVNSGSNMSYILYLDGAYKYLGEKPPETIIKFRLMSELVSSEDPCFEFYGNQGDVIVEPDYYSEGDIKEDSVERFTLIEAAAVNKFIKECEEVNKIVHPCLVRYAYRLYDGSYIMHSSPILLVPNTDLSPIAVSPRYTTNDRVYYVSAMVSDVTYEIVQSDLSEWKDIVVSVDIFMSPQISPRKADGKVTKIINLDSVSLRNSTNYGYFHRFQHGSTLNPIGEYGPKTLKESINTAMENGSSFDGISVVYGSTLYDNEFYKRVKDESRFYRVRSLDLDGLSDLLDSNYLFDNLDVSEGFKLANLLTGDLLPDDYSTHDTLSSGYQYVYNKRLNLTNVSKSLFDGFDLSGMIMDVEKSVDGSEPWTIYVHLKKEGREVVLKRVSNPLKSFYPMYLTYPDSDAYRMTIVRGNVEDGEELVEAYNAELQPHPFLNCAVFFNGFETAKMPQRRNTSPTVTSKVVEEPNKIYVSEVDNPYYFPLSGIYTVGTGKILGLASVTQALSQGQFGQFPLYVFASDGVWAMEVGSDGVYTTAKPISRDVCLNGDSITQTDNAVLFVTEKGVMMIGGSEVNCISEMMNGKSLDVSKIDGLMQLIQNEGVPESLVDMSGFVSYAQSSKMVYDYPNGRIVMFKPGEEYVFVFSLESLTWATLGVSIDNGVNAYPDALIQTGKSVKRMSEKIDYNKDDLISLLMVTRAVKLGSAEYKTLSEAVARWDYPLSDGGLLVWGSYDGDGYALIGDVRGDRIYRLGGSGYRYFRFGIVGKTSIGNRLNMISVSYQRKYGNRLR